MKINGEERAFQVKICWQILSVLIGKWLHIWKHSTLTVSATEWSKWCTKNEQRPELIAHGWLHMQDYQHRHKRTQTTCISLLSFSGSQKVLYFRGFFRAFTNFGSDKYYRTALEYVDVSIYVSLTGYNKACKDRVTFLWENCINQKSLPTYTDSENKVHVSPFIYNSRSGLF